MSHPEFVRASSTSQRGVVSSVPRIVRSRLCDGLAFCCYQLRNSETLSPRETCMGADPPACTHKHIELLTVDFHTNIEYEQGGPLPSRPCMSHDRETEFCSNPDLVLSGLARAGLLAETLRWRGRTLSITQLWTVHTPLLHLWHKRINPP